MASDGLGTNPGKLYLLKTIEHIKQTLLPTMKPPEVSVYDAGDVAKLEKAMRQTEDWIKKNKDAHQDVFYKREAKLMKLCDHIVFDCAKDTIYSDPMRRTPPPSEGGDSSRARMT